MCYVVRCTGCTIYLLYGVLVVLDSGCTVYLLYCVLCTCRTVCIEVLTLDAGLLGRSPVIRKVLRPATSMQTFLVSLCLSLSEGSDGSQHSK